MGIRQTLAWPDGRRRSARLLLLPLSISLALSTAAVVSAQTAPAKAPVDEANPLVGTAPLDRSDLIGNAPPPGEPVYSGQTSPGARLPHSSVEAAPINNNIALTYPNGVEEIGRAHV